ncbi:MULTISPECIES: DUF4407 domain-containing protein [unclassified Nocardia]|uniref:DUF4407 domain-containing protein n=1 Tax=unclassified Nocardia TaxID=2637762 RepID=UPI001CE41D04|nr:MULTISPECIES: DUF4407 domain-containing protein [unclassified Nocardia]
MDERRGAGSDDRNLTGVLAWLGGSATPARSAELGERHERAGYAVTGAVVLLSGVVADIVTGLVLGSADAPLFANLLAALLVGALGCFVGRALATARPGRMPDRFGMAARIGVAVVLGCCVAELAAVLAFGGSIDRTIAEKAQRSADSVPAVAAANAELDRAVADRAALDRAIAKARNDTEDALVIARCEVNPTPECPPTKITHVPGRGPESQTANDMLDDARKQLAIEQAKVDPLDQRIAADEKALAAARSAAVTTADRGLGARWAAMNDYTTHNGSALALRVLGATVFTLLALLPLILRWWRGETFLDRRLAARIVEDRAEREADAAIAIKRAEARAAAETLRADQELTATRLAVEAQTAIDREQQRTRIVAAIGGLQIGVAEPPRRELPAAEETREGHMTPNLPAPVTGAALTEASAHPAPEIPKRGGGLELPIIGTVPFTDTAARLIRPLVPSFVANAIDTATHPLRTARQAFEEVEEITFTLRRTRKVTVDAQDSHGGHPGYQLQPGSPEAARYAHQIAATVVDADYSELPNTPQGQRLSAGASHDELGGRNDPQLPGRRGPRELPPGN